MTTEQIYNKYFSGLPSGGIFFLFYFGCKKQFNIVYHIRSSIECFNTLSSIISKTTGLFIILKAAKNKVQIIIWPIGADISLAN